MTEEYKKKFDKVAAIIAETVAVKVEGIQLTSSLEEDLGMDDMDILDVVEAMEEEFNITITEDEGESVTTVQALVNLVP